MHGQDAELLLECARLVDGLAVADHDPMPVPHEPARGRGTDTPASPGDHRCHAAHTTHIFGAGYLGADMTFKRTNPLALAVLALLSERPMHPYEMAQTMRERHQEEVIKLNYGSLYTVVESLQRHELIAASATQRAGNRPERTVYSVTDAGTAELHDWLRELIAVPAQEYRRFEAGISM